MDRVICRTPLFLLASSANTKTKVQPETNQLGISDDRDIFYNDFPTDIAERWIPYDGLASNSTFYTPAGKPAWSETANFQKRRVYLRTLQDKALIPEVQTALIKASGVGWNAQDIDAGHLSFISEHTVIAEAISNAATALAGEGVEDHQILTETVAVNASSVAAPPESR